MARTMWCSSCTKNQPTQQNESGLVCCIYCGKVVDQDIYSSEPTFVKNAAGQSQLAGNVVRTVQSEYSVSRERTLNNAFDFINHIADNLGIGGGVTKPALRFYTIALERNFTRGRRADQVAAACLYIACRENNRPFLLIEFSEFLRVNIYVLGAVFLQLCKLLRLDQHPIVQKPVDPSLFIHRFTHVLLGEANHDVEKTALHIITSMKRDWMQTGRKPSGLCGASLYISALSHGLKFSKSDIVKIVHICEATLTKRLIEFEDTESGALTIEEFNKKAEEIERSYKSSKHLNIGDKVCGKGELLCEHRNEGRSHFAHGLCESCYDEFLKISGGLDGGSEPPAFQRAERERIAKASLDENAAISPMEPSLQHEKEIRSHDATKHEKLELPDSGEHEAGDMDKSKEAENIGTEGCDESETLSDIDDAEVDGYLHNEEEKHYKKIIWEEMNREYLEEQAAKEAAAAAAKEAYMANFQNCSPEMLAAQELAAAVAANLAKSKKERQQKRAAEAKTAQTAAEATHHMLTKKRPSSRINYELLKEIFDEPVVSEPKKGRTESQSEKSISSPRTKNEAEAREEDDDEMGMLDEHEGVDDDDTTEYQQHSYYDYEGEDDNDFDDGLY